MRFRKLRIAFSVISSLGCVLLIALWIRSYFVFDGVRGSVFKMIGLEFFSAGGQLAFEEYPTDLAGDWWWCTFDASELHEYVNTDPQYQLLEEELVYAQHLAKRKGGGDTSDSQDLAAAQDKVRRIHQRMDEFRRAIEQDILGRLPFYHESLVGDGLVGDAAWPRGATHPGFEFTRSDNGINELKLPHWFPVLVAPTLAVVPWLRWRYSLRTLLIATTVVAVVLGLAVYAARNNSPSAHEVKGKLERV
jgi:hypothetical protein